MTILTGATRTTPHRRIILTRCWPRSSRSRGRTGHPLYRARVIASDISPGAARRTRERARRYGLDITPIVADVERLPFADGAFDVVLVHDGLHHLEQPQVGLAEMARVARRWVSVTEPARAVATSIAVRAGVALEREESGNRVARRTPAEVAGVLRTAGFRPTVTSGTRCTTAMSRAGSSSCSVGEGSSLLCVPGGGPRTRSSAGSGTR